MFTSIAFDSHLRQTTRFIFNHFHNFKKSNVKASSRYPFSLFSIFLCAQDKIRKRGKNGFPVKRDAHPNFNNY